MGSDSESGEAYRFLSISEQAVIQLLSYFYESRDGSMAGYFADSVQVGKRVGDTVSLLLRRDRYLKV